MEYHLISFMNSCSTMMHHERRSAAAASIDPINKFYVVF